MDGKDVWAEIEKAEKENRRELVLQGANTDKRIQSNGGLNSKLYSLTLLNYLEISQCPSLTEINEDIGNLIHLQSLILCRNKIKSVPKSIGKLKCLKVLDVSVNELRDIPEEVSQLSELNTLNVSCNCITSLPKGLSQCVKLATINVSKNELTALPDDLFSELLELLSTIVASENGIEELSTDISNLAALKVGPCRHLQNIHFLAEQPACSASYQSYLRLALHLNVWPIQAYNGIPITSVNQVAKEIPSGSGYT